MRNEITLKPQSHLINILRTTVDHHPNFALFLGAGASRTSGVKLAGEMVKEWSKTCHGIYGSNESEEDFLKHQPWYGSPEEYSLLFEMLFDEPSQRRECIESYLKDASPSWGYIYLVNLLKNQVFNTVFTTNFDDLLNEACYQFSNDVRPIVCAHDSSIRSIRITSKRPKIVKLHGDFLFDNIKNTVSELETLEDNMKEKFRQYAGEFGLIVVGYSGCDRSVMDTLGMLLKSETNFPHGVYWCIRKGSSPHPNITMLGRYPKIKIIEIDGFDEFFADVHDALKLDLQPEMSDPYGTLVKRLNNLMESAKIPPPSHGVAPSVIQRDMALIGQKISNLGVTPSKKKVAERSKKQNSEGKSDGLDELPIPYEMLADVESNSEEQALKYLLKELDVRPSKRVLAKAFGLLSKAKLLELQESLMERMRASKDLFLKDPDATFDIALNLIDLGSFDLADEVLGIGYDIGMRQNSESGFAINYYSINKMQIKAYKGEEMSPDEIRILNSIAEEGELLEKMGANILLKEYETATRQMLEAINLRYVIMENVIKWPIVRLMAPHITDTSLKTKVESIEEPFVSALAEVKPALREVKTSTSPG